MFDTPTPLPVRASDLERERVVRALRAAAVEGRVSPETFSRRLDRVYAAKSKQQLAAALHELPRGPVRRFVVAATAWVSPLVSDIELAWQRPRFDRVVLPGGRAAQCTLILGRMADCDLVLRDPTVSLRHAALRCDERGWQLEDLGSTNGTRVNGWLVTGPTAVQVGDCITLGAQSLVLAGG